MVDVTFRLLPDDTTDAQTFAQVSQLLEHPLVLGGVLYHADGTWIGEFGSAPELPLAEAQQGMMQRDRQQHSTYDVAWTSEQLNRPYLLILRLDTASVSREVYAFIGRIAGLVLIIAVFVTIATLITLGYLVIMPIYQLRDDLKLAGEVAGQEQPVPQFESIKTCRGDELGEVIRAFEQMFGRVSRAIAELRASEAALSLSEEKFAKAFQASPSSFSIGTLEDGRFIEVNSSFTRLFGYEPAEVIGQTATDLNLWQNPEDRFRVVELLEKNGNLRNEEFVLRVKDGQLKTVLFSAETITIHDQLCLLGVVTDISERKQAQKALQESEERFRTLVEQAADAIFVVNRQGQFVDVNQRACESLGYTAEELLCLTIEDIHYEIPPGYFDEVWQRLSHGELLTIETTHRRKDGTAFPVEIRADMFEAGGQPFALALSRDITERKQAERAMARLAEIGELAAMIVHEVRNPLTTVLMGLNSLRQVELSERSQLRLSLALEEADRLQRLLNEILLYARQQTLQLDILNLTEFVVRELLDNLRSMPAALHRSIEFNGSAGEPIYVQGDRDKLKQVFINLITNACEAVPDGEIITWKIHQERDRGLVEIQIHNGGDPIPLEVLPKLTQPFFTTKSSGNGLGLAIVKRIIEAHQGDFHINSSATTGTIVTMRLPLAPTQ